ncbi:MAG: TatD family hydrolase [Chloroflexi bacterium]|nr:TatD family hydrolase [Chloroflexota bacterium]MCL5075160.1 TatD family hydrolase [Chloroflexota bacterium]
MIDTHVHLDAPEFDSDRDSVLKQASAAGVEQIITVGVDLKSSRMAIALAESHKGVYAAVGIHPHSASAWSPAEMEAIARLARHSKVVAIGETGLDYYRTLSSKEKQRLSFEAHLALARELALPVIVHDREAHDDVLAILSGWAEENKRTKGLTIGGVLHNFSGDMAMAESAIFLGFHLGIGGVVTFNNARRLVEVVRGVPLTHLLLETDSPYLTPHPWRGRRNEPANLTYVLSRVAELKKMATETLNMITTENAQRLFALN